MTMLTPPPKFSATFVDADGYTKPAVGYKLYAYTAGTSTPKDTYTSSTLGTANANPVVLDVRGEADVWMSGNYKFILKTDADVTVWTVDNVNDLGSGASLAAVTLTGAVTITSTAVTWSGNPTHSGNHTFSGNVVLNGSLTVGDAAADALTVLPNAVTWTNNPTHTGNHTWSGTQTFSANPAGKILSGTYTPTVVGGTNVSAITPQVCYYTRIGDMVTVTGNIAITPTTAASALTDVQISLPIASNITDATDIGGVGAGSTFGTTSNSAMTLFGDTGSNRAAGYFNAGSTSLAGWTFQFSYKVTAF
jgi:hypothetical protein